MTETIILSTNDVELILNENFNEREAFASLTLNPNIVWAKFVLLDDQPNGNKHRVPSEEFDNVIKTGRFMPIKSAESAISEDHTGSKPIGVITHLQKQDNTVIGLAALWIKERYDDVASIKEEFSKKGKLDVSWELGYINSETDDNGVKTFFDVVMNAVTIVGIPAYQGRTPITELASLNTTEEDNDMETITLDEHNTIVNALRLELETAKLEKTSLETEVASLTEFKVEVEAEKARLEKLASLKQKFSEAGLELTDEYLTANEEKLMGMTPEVLDFFVQELVAFASKTKDKETTASLSVTSSVPNLKTETKTNKTLAEQLRELDAK